MQASPSVLIVGAGFGGLAMAIELLRSGISDVTILERAGDLGGVWRDNTYPGAACDIPAPYYSLSYAPNPHWSTRFSAQQEINEYLHRVAAEYGIDDRVVYGVAVTAATYDDHTGRWQVDTATGDEYTADVFIPATGQLSEPALPDLPGVDSFAGPSFHSAQWDHSVDLTGKRVAVIGTGASAVQFVPEIQPQVAQLTVFQRSAPWILPRPEVRYRPWQHAMFAKFPLTQLVERFGFWLLCEIISLGLVDAPWMRPPIQAISARKLRTEVPDPQLRAKLTPDYPAGCKRGLFSDAYYPALTRDNVAVETTSIAEITTDGVRTSDGTLHEADVLVYGTGFQASQFLGPMTVTGAHGRRLSDVWRDGAYAYHGISVAGFPNMFVMYGPNTNLGCGSIIYMLESQARYIRQAVRYIAESGGCAVDVRSDVAAAYDAQVQAKLDRSVWTLCSSWYRNATGRITNNWPGLVSAYRWGTRRWRPDQYAIIRAPAHRAAVTTATSGVDPGAGA